MALDITAAILVLLLTGLGYHSGALKQMSRVIGAVLAFFAAPVVAAILRDILQQKLATQQGFNYGAVPDWPLLVAGGAIVYGVVSLLAFLAIRLMRASSDELTSADRAVGGGLGLLKALLIVYAATSVLLHFQDSIRRGDPEDKLQLRKSHVARAVALYPDGWEWVASAAKIDRDETQRGPDSQAAPSIDAPRDS